MNETILFSLSQFWWFYVGFLVFVILMLVLDLGVFHKNAHEVSFKEAAGWSVVWVTLALIFNAGLYFYSKYLFQTDPTFIQHLTTTGLDAAGAAKQIALEFFTGYVVEKSLAVDNIFVFVMIFSYFAIPKIYQHRILFYGILGALVFRAIFIAAGSLLLQYHIVVIIFGAFLLFTGIKMMFTSEHAVEPEKNIALRLLRKFIPIYPRLDGPHFLHKENGRTFATPLLVALVVVEVSDVLFALDSVPAIFAITHEPFLVFTSNIFAILGLRAMYFMLAGVVDKFYLLKYGLAGVLVFVGLKMVWLDSVFGGKFPIGWSLGIIATLIGGSILASVLKPQKQEPHS